ncbi:hypothetical protein RUM44_010200 [Polyplax serrata]|uniref:LAGLIDADG homing endonuclease n=1 Tax=Polyplax serrata TaxID=468196 RepID=A0ABR1AUX0_POLSC
MKRIFRGPLPNIDFLSFKSASWAPGSHFFFPLLVAVLGSCSLPDGLSLAVSLSKNFIPDLIKPLFRSLISDGDIQTFAGTTGRSPEKLKWRNSIWMKKPSDAWVLFINNKTKNTRWVQRVACALNVTLERCSLLIKLDALHQLALHKPTALETRQKNIGRGEMVKRNTGNY